VFYYSDGTRDSVYKSSSVWENSGSLKIVFKPAQPVIKVELGAAFIPDSDTKNNLYQVENNPK